jgi:hypothetical protein
MQPLAECMPDVLHGPTAPFRHCDELAGPAD